FGVVIERYITPYCFFFHAEDGIRDFHVTGVQTCALPISQPSGHFPLLKHESVQSRCSETDADRTQAHPPRTAYPLSTRLDLLPFHPVYACSAPGNNRQFLAANLRSPSLFYL